MHSDVINFESSNFTVFHSDWPFWMFAVSNIRVYLFEKLKFYIAHSHFLSIFNSWTFIMRSNKIDQSIDSIGERNCETAYCLFTWVETYASFSINQVYSSKNSTCAPKPLTKVHWMGLVQTMSGTMEHLLASKRSLKLDTVEASAMCGGSLFHGSTESTAKAAFCLARWKRGWRTLNMCPRRLRAAGGSKNSSADRFR